MRKTNGFGLFGVIIIMIITAVVSSVATGVIMLNNSAVGGLEGANIIDDKDLQEFITVYETIVTKYYDKVDKKAMLDAAEEGMLDFLGDKYTTFLGDEEYQEILDELSGTYNGIGIEIDGNKIMNVTVNSPAERAGIQAGDIIMLVNNNDVQNMASEELGNLIKNSSTDTIELQVKRNEDLLYFSLTKENLVNPTISYEKIENTEIGYVYIKNFSQNLSLQISNALKDLESTGIKSLIIDVRDNVGGYLSAAEETSSLFLEQGKRIYSLESNGNKYHYNDDTKEKREYPIVVLINNNSASAAEILAAALKESYGAKLVGTKSYGKGKVQQVVHSAKFTSAKWLTPKGNCIDGIGIIPDYTISNFDTMTDSQLVRAIELLSE